MVKQKEIFPVYFTGLHLTAIRCFGIQGAFIPFIKDGKTCQWNIILGNNGSGKTTILKSLVAAWAIKTEFFSKVNYPDLTRDKKFIGSIEFELGDSWLNKVTGESIENGTAKNANAPHKTRLTITGHVELLSEMPLFAYGASRLIGENPSGGISDFPAENLFHDNVPLINAEVWLKDAYLVELSRGKKNGERKTQKVIQLLLELFDGEVKEIKIDTDDGHPKVLFLTQFGWVRLHNLSLGYKSLIAWMVDLASRMMDRYPASKSPLEEPAIVLVDEIDLHLHPSFQRKLTGWLSGIFKKTQFIVTAHSPLVAQAGAEANIILLTREGDSVKVSQNPVDIRQWRVDQILTSDLFGLSSPHSEKTEAMLTARREILAKPNPNVAEPG